VLNGHTTVQAQRYALDVSAITPAGRRLKTLVPRNLEDYVAFGLQVIAPCSGTVVAVHAAEHDHPIAAGDRERPAGNHVVLHCGDHSLVLAHLRAGSIRARVGQAIRTGDPIGEVGNTGNSSEPHLHVHAVRGRTRDTNQLLFEGEPVALRLGDEQAFAVRGDIIEGPSRAGRP
jgi:murein DD-endopeptidase MepM/ murein hydrolase activator NlpD